MPKKFNLLDKVTDLLDYTLIITSNKKRYPSKYIEVIRYIVRINLEIFDSIMDANERDLNTEREIRYKLQTRAIRLCDRLSRMTELSYRHQRIGSDVLAHWQGLIEDVKYMTLKWRLSDSRR